MSLNYQLDQTPLPMALVDEILVLGRHVFGSLDSVDVTWRMQNMPELSVFSARMDAELVGFKIGYAATSKRYYSWLGGVALAQRRLGIAGELMAQQHNWVFSKGFEVIETEVLQDNHAMQLLNERSGFKAAGIRFDKDPSRIVYRKHRGGA